jgi:anti-sigma factor RsiW
MTDDEIQAYLEEGASALDQVFDSHLAGCAECRRRVSDYRQLHYALSQDRGFDLVPGFSDAVMARVAVVEAQARRRRWWNIFFIVLGALTSVAATAYLVNLQPVAQTLIEFLRPTIQRSAEAFGQAEGVIGDTSKGTILVVVFSAVVLALVAGIDHLLFKGRHAKYCL